MSPATRVAYAHAGDSALPAAGPVISPRAEARSGPLELVAVYKPGTIATVASPATRDVLALFVTRYADGTPVANARVEAGGDLETVSLRETDPGVYVSHDLMISPGRNDLNFTIKLPGQEDRTQAVALLVPGGAIAATTPALPAAGRISPVAIGLAVFAVYATMMGAFLLVGGGARLQRMPMALRIPWGLRPLRRAAVVVMSDPVA